MNLLLSEIVADTFGLDPASVTPETAATNTPEWDSVMHLNLCLSLEQTYGLSFTPEEMNRMTSVAAIEALLAQRGVK